MIAHPKSPFKGMHAIDFNFVRAATSTANLNSVTL